ncbi:MAG: restriction endonuclease subunit S [Micrococcales bacterium]|nr:restriction endonuclease subunit S [Micrococcales bacterium]
MSFMSTTLGAVCAKGGGAIATGPFGSQLHASDYSIEGTPVVMPKDIGDNRIVETNISRVSGDHVTRLSRHRLFAGDIVYSRRGDVERRALIRAENNGWLCGTGCLRVSFGPDSADSAEYVSYQLGLPETRKWIVRHAVGATMLNLNTSILSSVPLRMPDLSTQQGIAEVLGALDDKIAANAPLGDTSMELAGSFFDQAVSGLPTRPMSSVLKPVLGGTPSRQRDEFWSPGEHPWASAKDVASASLGVVIDTAESISREAIAQTKAKPLPTSSVILTARGTVGAVARLGEPMSFNQSCYGFVPGKLPPGVLYFSVLRATERAKAMAHGSVFDTITMRTFDHLEVADLDGNGLAQLEARVAPLLVTAEQHVRESRSIAATRDMLLPLLMSGKIRVKDAERVVEEVV